MIITRAKPEDAEELTMIACEAKRYWGYPESWIRQWNEALTVTSGYIRDNPTFVAAIDETIVGFCAIRILANDSVLDHLWVLPTAMRRGVGRALFMIAEKVARECGVTRIMIVGDPYAEKFYKKMGATIYGQEPAPMDGQARFLPLLEKNLG